MSLEGGSLAGEGWVVRAMQSSDVPGVAALAAEEPTAPHWPIHEYHRMLEVIDEAPARRGAWVLVGSYSPWERAGNQINDQIGGFCMASHVADICELEAVVVRAMLRGNRLGESLVRAVVAWGRSLNAVRLELEVRASNMPAVRLYERLGFVYDGRRGDYYQNPTEDAILMSLAL